MVEIIVLHSQRFIQGGKNSDLDILSPPPAALADMIQDSYTPTPLFEGRSRRGVPLLYQTVVRISKKKEED